MAGIAGDPLRNIPHGDHFRPDLEGLRAIAVLLVLLYHVGVPGFAGGFVGVDIFFVLSGFLITGLLLRELRSTGALSIRGFYARRARRLLPAAGLVLLVTLGASVVVLSPLRIAAISADIGSAATYISNIRFAVQANDYFATSEPPSPVLHYWSLSVEEQFYVVWPALLLLLYRRGRPWMGIGVGILVVASFGLSFVLTGVNQPAAFYLLPARAWQLGVGALLALAGERLSRTEPTLGTSMTLLGLGGVAAASLLFSNGTVFPGLGATLPVASAALVIAGGAPRDRTVAARLLGVRPLRYIGTISYSIYLWHWPLLVFAAAAVGHPLSLRAGVAVAALSIPIAGVIQRLVERPLRRGDFISAVPSRNLIQAFALTLTIAVACGIVSRLQPSLGVSAVDDFVPPLAEAAAPWPYRFCDEPDRTDPPCVIGDPAAGFTIALFGDSHATSWVPAVARLAAEHGWRFLNMTEGRCPSIPVTFWNGQLDNIQERCGSWRSRAVARIIREQPDIVVITNRDWYQLAGSSGDKPLVLGMPEYTEAWKTALTTTIAEIRPYVGSITVIGDTPHLSVSGPDCIAQNAAYATICVTPRSIAISQRILDSELAASEAAGANFIDPTNWLCNRDVCAAVIGRYIAYRDDSHFTIAFAQTLGARLGALLPLVEP